MSNLISEVTIRRAEDTLGITKKEIDHKELKVPKLLVSQVKLKSQKDVRNG